MSIRNQKIAVYGGIIVVVAAFILFGMFYQESFTLPTAFREVHDKAALVSDEITKLTSDTAKVIEDIEFSDNNGDVGKAKDLIESARATNQEAYSKAFELSSYLRVMAESLSGIDSKQAQQRAYEALAIELGLVSEFINYTRYMDSFLDGLDQAVLSNDFSDRKTVEQLEKEINRKVDLINKLNDQFRSKMKPLVS